MKVIKLKSLRRGGIVLTLIKQALLKMLSLASTRISCTTFCFCSCVPNTSLRVRNHARNCTACAAVGLPAMMLRLRLDWLLSEMSLLAQNCWISLLRYVLRTNFVFATFSPVLGQVVFPQ